MKKLWVVILICSCISPVYAQRGRGFLPKGKSAALKARVQASLSRTRVRLTQPNVPHIQITNLPGEPLVKLGGAVDNAPAVLSARLLDGEALHAGVFPETGQMVVPSALTANEDAVVYRGMYIDNLEDIENILINGLEINKSYAYPGQIYATPLLRVALDYAIPPKYFLTKPGVEPEIPVVVKIRLTPELLDKKASVSWGAEHVFSKDIPADALADVMMFLEVDGKPGWYKAAWKDNALSLTSAVSKQVQVDRNLYSFAGEFPANMPDNAQSPKTQHIQITNMPGQPTVNVWLPQTAVSNSPVLSAMPEENTVSMKLAQTNFSQSLLVPARILDRKEFHQSVFREHEFRHLPTSLNSEIPAVYRGMNLGSLKEIKNILVNGLQREKTYYQRLFFSADIDVAVFFANDEQSVPVVVKVEVTSELEEFCPLIHDYDDNYTFSQDIPASFLTDVFTYIEIDGQGGWYKVILLNGELILKPVTTQDYRRNELIIHKFGRKK